MMSFSSKLSKIVSKIPTRSIFTKTEHLSLGKWGDVLKPAGSPSQLSKEPIENVRDMSIHGLDSSSIKQAIKNTLEQKKPASESPLGRWKVEVNNFEKGYSYDHSA